MVNLPDEKKEILTVEEINEIPAALLQGTIRLTKMLAHQPSAAFAPGDPVVGTLLTPTIEVNHRICLASRTAMHDPNKAIIGPSTSPVTKIIMLSDGTYRILTAKSVYRFDPKENILPPMKPGPRDIAVKNVAIQTAKFQHTIGEIVPINPEENK